MALPAPEAGPLAAGIAWIDLHAPTAEEERQVESLLEVDLPTRDDLRQIEPSSRLYREDGAVFLTATVVCRSDSEQPENGDIAFVLARGLLVTIRYAEPKAFGLFAAKLERHPDTCRNGLVALVHLLDAIVDRSGEVLERAAARVDQVPARIFLPRGRTRKRRSAGELEAVLSEIEGLQRLTAKVRESLVSLGRVLGFLLSLDEQPFDRDLRARAVSIAHDAETLSDHASFVSGNIGFLLDASLGLISIEQNAIIKFFSIVAVVLLPPTLIGTVYGMNFRFMPELDWVFGYPLAIALMIVSAVLPYLWFRRQGWL